MVLSHSNPKLKILIHLLFTNPPLSLRRGVIDEPMHLTLWLRMHTGISLEMCSLVPLTTSWTDACLSVGAPSEEIHSRAAEIEKQMAGEGCIEVVG